MNGNLIPMPQNPQLLQGLGLLGGGRRERGVELQKVAAIGIQANVAVNRKGRQLVGGAATDVGNTGSTEVHRMGLFI